MPSLDFKGKPFVYSHHLSVPFRELRIDADKSLPGAAGPNLDDNLIIHGDNLEALKALLPRYAGKVDVIYIDPPYNTGNEGWAYNDNVNAPAIKEWLGKTVDAEDMERHDKWLAMMWPRLQLLKELLSPSGYILVSSDSVEVANLRSILDEIFPAGFIGTLTWESKTKSQNTKSAYRKLQPKTEFIQLYTNGGANWFNLRSKGEKSYPLSDSRGPYRRFVMEEMSAETVRGRQTMSYPILGLMPRKGKQWQIGKDVLDGYCASGDVSVEDGKPIIKMRPDYERTEITEPFWAHFDKGIGTAESARADLNNIIPSSGFDTVKPVALIERLLFHVGGKDAIVLDSFAGSGTTAQAVLARNVADGGSRRFILVEMEDYADKLTAERVRRVIQGVPAAKDEALRDGLGGSFTYCKLGGVMDLERFFAGEGGAPSWDRLAEYVAYTATGATMKVGEEGKDGYAGEAGGFRLHLIYRPDQAWMRSNEAMLDIATAERIAAAAGGQPTLVFAAGKFMSQKALTGIGLTFCQLPYSIHRILGDGSEGVAGVDAA